MDSVQQPSGPTPESNTNGGSPEAPEFQPAINPEQGPQIFQPEALPPAGLEKQAELQIEQRQPGSQGTVLPPAQDMVLPIPPPSTAVPTSSVVGVMPAVADDVDVIEMEWVNKAKQVIRDTKDDPHAQEEAMEELQVEYLKKRYGKDIRKKRG